MAAKTDPAMAPLHKEAQTLWLKLGELRKAAELAAARRKDAGVVLWTVFVPEKHGQHSITRTPNILRTERRYRFSNGVFGYTMVRDYCADSDFRTAMTGKF